MLQLNNVEARYGSFKALEQVSMSVEQGELVVLLGANGAGKSTLFNTISGLIKPSAGTISLDGTDVTGLKPSGLVQSGFPILDEKKDQAAGSLSGGQQQMVAIGRAMMGRPKLLLLDEPSLGLAPLVVKQMFETIKGINEQGTTVLLAEQNAFAALKIAHRAYVIENGRLVMEGDKDAMLGNEAIRKAYIGA